MRKRIFLGRLKRLRLLLATTGKKLCLGENKGQQKFSRQSYTILTISIIIA